MIASSIYANEDLSKYPNSIQTAVEYVKSHDFTTMEPGEYPIDGDKIYAKVFDLTSKEIKDTMPEIHKKYIDVQFWVSGQEMMGYAPKKADYPVLEAHEDQDLYFLGSVPDEIFIKAIQGDYMVFFPSDVHRPGTVVDGAETYRKVVVKVRVDTVTESI